MSVDCTFYCMYGFARKSDKQISMDEFAEEVADAEMEEVAYNADLEYVSDYMCGEYDAVGVIIFKSEEYYDEDDNSWKTLPNIDIEALDQQLRNGFKKIKSISYDLMCKTYGKPQIHIFVHMH